MFRTPTFLGWGLMVSCLIMPATRQLISANPQSSAVTSDNNKARGIRLYQQDKINEAAEVIRKAVRENKQDYEAWYFLGLWVCGAKAQQPTNTSDDRARGIQLYQQGDTNRAIEVLREVVGKDRDDGDAWHYLGLAFLQKGDRTEGRKAFAKAAAIREKALESFLSVPDKQDPQPARPKNADRYQAAVESFEKVLELTLNPSQDFVDELDALRWYRDYYAGFPHDEEIRTSKEVTTKLRIVSKPPPIFSGTSATGTARLRGMFSADGKVKHILVLHKIDPAFDRACIEAAKKIQFQPAIKDNHPVSMILQIEYNRHMY